MERPSPCHLCMTSEKPPLLAKVIVDKTYYCHIWTSSAVTSLKIHFQNMC